MGLLVHNLLFFTKYKGILEILHYLLEFIVKSYVVTRLILARDLQKNRK
jgi:hypothetical protein